FLTMPGRQARESHTAAFMSTSMTRCQSASAISRNVLLGLSAALLIRASTAPNALIASSAMRLHSAALPTSPMTTIALTPNFSASLATFSQAARSLEPLIATLKPSSARPSTQARPIFLPPPVTRAALPLAAMSDHSAGAQFLDLLRADAEALQHGIVVLAEIRRRLELPGLRRGSEVDRVADHLDLAELGMLDAARDAEMLDLRLGEGHVDRVDRPGRHARLVHCIDPM